MFGLVERHLLRPCYTGGPRRRKTEGWRAQNRRAQQAFRQRQKVRHLLQGTMDLYLPCHTAIPRHGMQSKASLIKFTANFKSQDADQIISAEECTRLLCNMDSLHAYSHLLMVKITYCLRYMPGNYQ